MSYPYKEMRRLQERDQIRGMSFPVRCSCGRVYDMGTVTVYARYSDCSCWMTPCCHRHEDDRPGIRRYVELNRDGRACR